ncbi:transmembrane amino acid transporter protein-domain-containing protein [Calycina marina]|uniref:Transmembrane amino acid transporter protein-domain-containing protein n=1 Tax=Calycina marina TaxID=1763456 RepID=A0A9P8CBL8_9HELO|nr:transmembrane amino acid transporter protein-domain-containing protein [Calycina marina]
MDPSGELNMRGISRYEAKASSSDNSGVEAPANNKDGLPTSPASYKRIAVHVKSTLEIDPFSTLEDGENDIQYKNLSWWQCSFIMLAETVSLGILSLPYTLEILGVIPGVILIVALGILSAYTGMEYGMLRNAHPGITSIGDAFRIVFAPLGHRLGINWAWFGQCVGDISQLLFMTFLMASHVLTWTIALNNVGGRICSIWYGIIGTAVFILLGLPRTLKCISYLSVLSALSVFIAVLVTMISLGMTMPSTGLTGTNPYHLWPINPPPFYEVFLVVTNIVFAYAGHAAYFNFITELKNPREFPKSLALLQTIDIVLYSVSAVVIYIFAGSHVESPALNSTSHHVQIAAWCIALPTILIAGVIYGHVITKDIFLRFFKGTRHITKNTRKGKISWVAIVLVIWVVAWVLSESIADFNTMLGLIVTLFGSWFTYGAPGIFWLFLNHGRYTLSWKTKLLTCLNIILVAMGAAIFGLGIYSTSYSIHRNAQRGRGWKCLE